LLHAGNCQKHFPITNKILKIPLNMVRFAPIYSGQNPEENKLIELSRNMKTSFERHRSQV